MWEKIFRGGKIQRKGLSESIQIKTKVLKYAHASIDDNVRGGKHQSYHHM